MAISQNELNEKQLNIKTITWGELTWLDIVPPTEKETEYLAETYRFHHLDLEDCLNRKQLPKIDEYKDYLFVIFHFVTYNKQTRISSHSQVSVFLGEKYLITLHTGELKVLTGLFQKCLADEEARRENFSHGSGYILFTILNGMADAYFPLLDKIFSLIEDIEESVFDQDIEAPYELSILRRDIVTQRRIIFPMRAVMAELEDKLKRFINTDISVYYSNLMDHMNKICESLDECEEVIEIFNDTDFVLSNYRLNRIVRVLTIMSSILLPFLVISSLYGMNVILPGGLEKGSLSTFLVLLVVMVLISGGMLYFFHRRHWI